MKAKKTNDLCFCSSSSPQGGCSACHLLMGLGSALPAQPSPSLLESTAWSDPVCQLSSLFSHGSVFDRCVRGWRSRRCQLSPCQERGAGGRPGGSAQPPVLPRLQGQRACWVGMMRRPRAFRAAQGHAPGLWPQGSPLLSYKKAQELLQSFANPMGIITPQQ